VTACAWMSSRPEPAEHCVERETRPGLILTENVCSEHLTTARNHGYKRRGPAEVDDQETT
jgi:hypothetical protein